MSVSPPPSSAWHSDNLLWWWYQYKHWSLFKEFFPLAFFFFTYLLSIHLSFTFFLSFVSLIFSLNLYILFSFTPSFFLPLSHSHNFFYSLSPHPSLSLSLSFPFFLFLICTLIYSLLFLIILSVFLILPAHWSNLTLFYFLSQNLLLSAVCQNNQIVQGSLWRICSWPRTNLV